MSLCPSLPSCAGTQQRLGKLHTFQTGLLVNTSMGRKEGGREGGGGGRGEMEARRRGAGREGGRARGRREEDRAQTRPPVHPWTGWPPPLLPPAHRHARLLESSGHLPRVITRALSRNSSPGVTESSQPEYCNSKPSLVQMQGQADKSEGLGPDSQMPILTAWLPDSLGPSGFLSFLLWLKARPCAQSQWADGSHSCVKSWSCQHTAGPQQLLGPLPSYPENPGRLGGAQEAGTHCPLL